MCVPAVPRAGVEITHARDVERIPRAAPRAPLLGLPARSQGGRSQDSVSRKDALHVRGVVRVLGVLAAAAVRDQHRERSGSVLLGAGDHGEQSRDVHGARDIANRDVGAGDSALVGVEDHRGGRERQGR